MIDVKFRLLSDGARMPTHGSPGASGYDLYLPKAVTFDDVMMYKITLGIAIELPEGYEAQIRPRSSSASKHGLIVIVGTVDSDYRGELAVCLFNPQARWPWPPKVFEAGDRICQLVIAPTMGGQVNWLPADTLGDTERGSGGFGSTGK